MKPIIGITAKYSDDSRVGLISEQGVVHEEWQIISNGYIKAITEAGGIPLIIPVYEEAELVQDVLEVLDGVLFSGGSDLDPSYYGEGPHENLGKLVPKMDRQEIGLYKKIMKETQLPVLGICRGMQMANVAEGGGLYQDLVDTPAQLPHSQSDQTERYKLIHSVKVEKSSKLFEIIEQEEIQVNSFHHQTVKAVGEGLQIVGRAEDGVIEALEGINKERFAIFVQWHPEMLAPSDSIEDMVSKKLFCRFVEECGNNKKRR